MIWNWDINVDGAYPDSFMQLDNIPLKNVKTFKYPGVWNTFDDMHIGQWEVEYRINSAKCAFAENRKMLTNRNIRLNTRINFLNGLVRSGLMYGCHAWRPTKPELSKISSTYNNFLRSMVHNGFKR